MGKLPVLDHFSKKLFQVGMKEWRVRVIYIENHKYREHFHKIIATDSIEAIKILLKHARNRDENDWDNYLEKNYPNGINNITCSDNSSLISDRFNGIVCDDYDHPCIFSIDPFDGSFKLIGDYPHGFCWDDPTRWVPIRTPCSI